VSYTNTLPTNKDKVRLLIGDTDTSAEMLVDNEINAVLALQPTVTFAAAACADAIAAKYARKVDLSIGATSVSLSQRAEAFRDLAARLRAGGAGSLPGGDGTGVPGVSMFVGGTSVAVNDTHADDADEVPPSFGIGMDDAPGTASPLTKWGTP
jgi:hypothetical protein